MSWIRDPVYMITHADGHIICYGMHGGCCLMDEENDWWMYKLTNETQKQRAKIVLDHLLKHYKDFQKKGEFDKAEKLSFIMEDIYMNNFTNRLFKQLQKKYWLKFMEKYDLD